MDESSVESGVQGIGLILFGLILAIADLSLSSDGATLLLVSAGIVGLLGVLHSFRPLL